MDLEPRLAALAKSGWTTGADKIARTYTFKSFGDAFAFMARCAPEIEKLDHHPEWRNVYNKVEVELTTHSAGRVTPKDVELAEIMDNIAGRFLTASR